MSETLTPDVGEFGLRVGDVLLLATDGVVEHLGDAQIIEALTAEGGPDASLGVLFDALARTPWKDNASAIVMQV